MYKLNLRITNIYYIIIIMVITACNQKNNFIQLENFILPQNEIYVEKGKVKRVIIQSNPKKYDQKIIWITKDEKIAVVQYNSIGSVAGVKGVNVGKTEIIVKSQDGRITETLRVNVIIKIEAIAIARTDSGTGNVVVTMPNTLDLATIYTVTPTPTVATLSSITWTVDTQTGETGRGTIASNVFTPTMPGIITLQAEANEQTATVVVEIVRPVATAVTIANVNEIELTLAGIEKTIQLSAIVTPADALQTVAWTITTTPIPTGYSIDTNTGMLTLKADVIPTTITVLATSTNGDTNTNGGIVASLEKSIVFVRPPATAVTIFNLVETELTLTGTPKTIQLTATVTPSGADQTVTWAITNSPVPTGYSIDANTGMLTLKADAKPTTIKVVATSTNGDPATNSGMTVSPEKSITFVPPATATVVTIADLTVSDLVTGASKTIQLSATVTPTTALQTVTWAITNSPVPAGYSIDANTGMLTLKADAKPTTITVVATSTNGNPVNNSGMIVSPAKSLVFTAPVCNVRGTGDIYLATATTTGATTNIDYSGNIPTNYYEHYTTETITVQRGSSFDLTITQSVRWSRTMVWIDWNGNKDFESIERVHVFGVENQNNDGPFMQTFTIPNDAMVGRVRMRIVTGDAWIYNDNDIPNKPCDELKNSSTKDFDIEIRK